MSTILKALRRLEEDSSIEVGASPGSLPGADSRTADELRSRILAEESAAEASGLDSSPDTNSRNRLFKIVALAAGVAMLGGIGAGLYSSRSVNPSAKSPPGPPPAQAQQTASRLEQLAPPTRVGGFVTDQPHFAAGLGSAQAEGSSSQPSTASAPKNEVVSAAVVPTSAVLESQSATMSRIVPPSESNAARLAASAEKSAPPSRVRPTSTRAERRAIPMQASVSAAKIQTSSVAGKDAPAGRGRSLRSGSDRGQQEPESALVSETKIAAKSPPARRPEPKPKVQPDRPPNLPAAPKPKSGTAVVEQHNIRGLPDVTVLRTAWHPSPDRRSAKLRMRKTKEILTLKEGDAVGSLVIQKITPSAVLFRSGEIEIRLRVGQPGSGG